MEWDVFSTLVKKTRTAHHFQENYEVPDGLIEKILEISLLAPNHRLTYPWEIIEASTETRIGLSVIAGELAKEKGLIEEGVKKAKKKALAPSRLIVFIQNRKPDNPFEEREDYATISCSIQLLALGLQSHGLHYKWSTGGLSRHEKTYDLLGVDIKDQEIIGFVWVGQAIKEPRLKDRPQLSEVLRQK